MPLSVSGCLNNCLITAGGAVITSAPSLAASWMWIGLRTLATRSTLRSVRTRPRLGLAVLALLAVLMLGATAFSDGGDQGPAPRFEHAHFGPH